MRRAAALACAIALSAPMSAFAVGTSSTSSTPDFSAREMEMFGDEEAAREADMFGDADDASRDAEIFSTSTSTAVTRDERVLGGEPGVIGRLAAAAAEADDYLALGGELWLWGQWAAYRDGPLKTFPLSSPSFMDVYLDARPNDRIRAYSRFRLSYDFTIDPTAVGLDGQPVENPALDLDQLWLKFDIFRTVFVTFGKQRIRWGSGRVWNPTDFLNNSPIDSFAFFDRRLGVPMLKLHYPVESLGWNFYAIALLDGADRLDKVGGAVRAELVVWNAELALSAAARKDQPFRFGFDLNTALWWFDLKAELAVRYDEKRSFYEGRFLLDGIDTLESPTAVDRSNEFIPQLVLGAEISIPYSDQDSIILLAEYFYNDVSFEDPSLYPVPLAAAVGVPGFEGGSAVQFNPLFWSRHYGALTAVLVGPGDFNDTTIAASAAFDLTDATFFARVNYSVQLLTFLRLNAFVGVTGGPVGGAFAFEFEVPPVPGVLDNGFRIRSQPFQVGASLNVSL